MTHDELKAKALAIAAVRDEYDRLGSEFEQFRYVLQAYSQTDLSLANITMVSDAEFERLAWLSLSLAGLNNAYGDAEPDYALTVNDEARSDC